MSPFILGIVRRRRALKRTVFYKKESTVKYVIREMPLKEAAGSASSKGDCERDLCIEGE